MKNKVSTDKKKNKISFWELLNPNNLRSKIDSYGYELSKGKYTLFIMIVLMCVITLGAIFNLRWPFVIIIVLFFLIQLPSVILDLYRNMYEHKRFLDLSDYIEQMLYSFKLNQKILTSLRDTASLFKGRMNQVLLEAVSYIENGASTDNLYKEAFAIIENELSNNRRVLDMHKYLYSAEKNGGNSDGAIELLVKDKNIWVGNVLKLQAERKNKKNFVFGALFITIAAAAVFQRVYSSLPMEYNILDNVIIQISTTVFLLIDIFVFCKANHEIAKSWIDDDNRDNEKVFQYYQNVIKYDVEKERKHSLVLGIPTLIVAVIAIVILKKAIVGGVLAVFGIFFLNQHKIGYRIYFNEVSKELNIVFPQWLMQMALLLQTNNVRRSIELSIEDAPLVLRLPLSDMIEQLKKEPNAKEPFQNFLAVFELSGIQSSMMMLYSLVALGSGEATEQIKMMIDRNIGVMDKAEKMKNEKKLTGITSLALMPQVSLMIQFLVGMTMMLLTFVSSM